LGYPLAASNTINSKYLKVLAHTEEARVETPIGCTFRLNCTQAEGHIVVVRRPSRADIVEFDVGTAPYLVVIVDAEEEFEWTKFSPSSTSVRAMGKQGLAQRILERFGIVPTYVVDYPVASQAEGFKPLREFLDSGLCEVGAQLHPWVNPPIREDVVLRNTYPGNLDRDLEFEKLRTLTATIEQNLDIQPTIYRAGRCGFGPNTAEILEELGYQIDCSILPGADLRHVGGPDFRACNVAKPFWIGSQKTVLELPITAGYTGVLRRSGPQIQSLASRSAVLPFRLRGILSRGGLLDSIRLSPEGIPLADAKRLTRTLLRSGGHRVFSLSYHSPSLEAGNTPYVRDGRDLERFLAWIEGYLEFFFGELRGRAATPGAIRQFAHERLGKPVAAKDLLPAPGIVGQPGRPVWPQPPGGDPANVSAIIPAYNAEGFVGRAIESALDQTVLPIEVLVIDDGSQDDTAAVVAGYGPPVRLLRKANGGPASARNLGAREARGDWLAFLDADDLWKASKLERQLAVAAVSRADLVQSLVLGSYRIVPRNIEFDQLWASNCIATSSVLLRRAVFEEAGGFDEDPQLISVEDYNLWLRLAASRKRLITCFEELTIYTRSDGLSSQASRFMSANLHNIEKIGRELGMPLDRIERQRAEILESFGMGYLYTRGMLEARRALWHALRVRPTARRTARFAISLLPAAVLDTRKRLFG
jgi:glycosyltransferase involved in cell wall biosynthesis